MNNRNLMVRFKNTTEDAIASVLKDGIQINNLDLLCKLSEIHKNVSMVENWEGEDNYMRYSNYGRGGYGDGSYGRYGNRYGRYSDGSYGRGGSYGRESYGRRGKDAKYRGHYPEDMMDDMYMGYQGYAESRDSYGAKEDTMGNLEEMLESMVEFIQAVKEEAGSQEEVELIRKYAKQLSEM